MLSMSKTKRSRHLARFVLLVCLTQVAIRLSADAQQPIHHAATKKAKTRKATLRELYAMFFNYAAHIDVVSDANAKAGKDVSIYKAHLQKASGLSVSEYEYVRQAAHRFSPIDGQVIAQLEAYNKASITGGALSKSQIIASQGQLRVLIAQRSSSLKSEIAGLAMELDNERTKALETYLQTEYIRGGIASSNGGQGGVTTPTTSGQDQEGVTSSTKISQTVATTSNPILTATGTAAPLAIVTPSADDEATVVLSDGGSCSDDDYVCADAQVGYLGTPGANYVELYADATLGDAAEIDSDNEVIIPEELDYEGDLSTNGGPETVYCVDTACPGYAGLIADALYAWDATGTFIYLYDCDGDGSFACEAEEQYTDEVDFTIPSPDLSTDSFSVVLGTTQGTFLIDGTSLVSPFLNPPTVTVTNDVLDPFTVQSYSEPDDPIAASYTLQSTAVAGSQTITVSNGFGSDTASLTLTAPPPVIDSISVVGSTANTLQAGTTQTIMLTGTNFGSTAPNITIGAGGTGVTVVAGSATAPSSTGTTPAVSPASGTLKASVSATNKRGSVTSNATAQPEDSGGATVAVSFQVVVASDAPAGAVSFILQANDGADNPTASSPPVDVAAVQPVAPIILDLLAADNNFTCSGENIGQGAASAQQVVVGQLVSFTACVPQGSVDFGAVATGTWTPPTVPVPFTFTNYAVQTYAVGNLTNYPPTYPFGPGQYPASATVIPVVPSPACTSGTAFCDYQLFAFVMPGTYDFTFSYSLGNGTAPVSATIEYIVLGPTNSANCVIDGVSCAFSQVQGSPTIQVFAPGQLSATSPGALGAGNPSGTPFLDVVISAIPPSDVEGAFQWVQEINSRNTQFLNAQNVACNNCSYSGPLLDNVYPYAINPAFPTEAVDNPSVPLSFSGTSLYEVNDNFQAQMYLLWDPSLNDDGTSANGCAASTFYNSDETLFVATPSSCSGSIPVPLGSLTWGYCATAINSLGQGATPWILTCPTGGIPDVQPAYIPASGVSSYPTWNAAYLNN